MIHQAKRRRSINTWDMSDSRCDPWQSTQLLDACMLPSQTIPHCRDLFCSYFLFKPCPSASWMTLQYCAHKCQCSVMHICGTSYSSRALLHDERRCKAYLLWHPIQAVSFCITNNSVIHICGTSYSGRALSHHKTGRVKDHLSWYGDNTTQLRSRTLPTWAWTLVRARRWHDQQSSPTLPTTFLVDSI